eukprot:jgi/Psemu1/328564/estExt_fgenesh1_pg.C_15910001
MHRLDAVEQVEPKDKVARMNQRHVLLTVFALVLAPVIPAHSHHDSIDLGEYYAHAASSGREYHGHLHMQSSSLPTSSENQKVIENKTSKRNRNVTRTNTSFPTIRSNQHGLLSVSILVDLEEQMVTGNANARASKDDSGLDIEQGVLPLLSTFDENNQRRPTTYHEITSDNIIWTVSVEEAQVGKVNKPRSMSLPYTQQIYLDWKDALKIDESALENENDLDPHLNDEGNINVTSKIKSVRQKIRTIHHSGNANCTFVIPLERYEPADTPPSIYSSAASSYGAQTFIVSLMKTICHPLASTRGSITFYDDESRYTDNRICRNKTTILLTRRLATLPRKTHSHSLRALDPVARVVLRHSQQQLHYVSSQYTEQLGAKTEGSFVQNDDVDSSSHSHQDSDSSNDFLWTIFLLLIVNKMRSINTIGTAIMKNIFSDQRQDALKSYSLIDVVDQQQNGSEGDNCCYDPLDNQQEKEHEYCEKECICNRQDVQYDSCHECFKNKNIKKDKMKEHFIAVHRPLLFSQPSSKMTTETCSRNDCEFQVKEHKDDLEDNSWIHGSSFSHVNRHSDQIDDYHKEKEDDESDQAGNNPDDKIIFSAFTNVPIRPVDGRTAKIGSRTCSPRTDSDYISPPNDCQHNDSSTGTLDLKASHYTKTSSDNLSFQKIPHAPGACLNTLKEAAHSEIRNTSENSIQNMKAKTVTTKQLELSLTGVSLRGNQYIKHGILNRTELSIQDKQPPSLPLKDSIDSKERPMDKKVGAIEKASALKEPVHDDEANSLQRRNVIANSSFCGQIIHGQRSFDTEDRDNQTHDRKKIFKSSTSEVGTRDYSMQFKVVQNTVQVGNSPKKDLDDQKNGLKDHVQRRTNKTLHWIGQHTERLQRTTCPQENTTPCYSTKGQLEICQETRPIPSTRFTRSSPVSLTPRGQEILTQFSDFEEHKMHSASFAQSTEIGENEHRVGFNDKIRVHGARSSSDQGLVNTAAPASAQDELKLDQSHSENKMLALQQTCRNLSGRSNLTSENEESYVSTLAPDSEYASDHDLFQFLPPCSVLQSQVLVSKSNTTERGNDQKQRNIPTGMKVSSHDCVADSKELCRRKRKVAQSSGTFGNVQSARDSAINAESSLGLASNETDLDSVEIVRVTMPEQPKKRCRRPYSKSNYVADWVPSNALQSISQDFFNEESWEIDAPDLQTSNATFPKSITRVPKNNKMKTVATSLLPKQRSLAK